MGSYVLLAILVVFYLLLSWIDRNPENKKHNQEALKKMLEKYNA